MIGFISIQSWGRMFGLYWFDIESCCDPGYSIID